MPLLQNISRLLCLTNSKIGSSKPNSTKKQTVVDSFMIRIVRQVAIISPMRVVSIDCRQPKTVIIMIHVFKLGHYVIVYVGHMSCFTKHMHKSKKRIKQNENSSHCEHGPPVVIIELVIDKVMCSILTNH